MMVLLDVIKDLLAQRYVAKKRPMCAYWQQIKSVHVEVDIYVDDVVFTPPISSVRAQNSLYIYIYSHS
jgi:hypothetical protein